MSIADIRTDYRQATLSESDVADDPITQFLTWFDQALAARVPEPNAVCVATVGADGCPSARMVLLKGADQRGFVFYTDYRSRKGQELTLHPCAALCFFWTEVERQVRITGSVERISRDEANEYFQSRPRGSQIGAWTSVQSSVLTSRSVLENELQQNMQRFSEGDIPLPEHWGGFRIIPREVEFWQGRASRLHDRIRYVRDGETWHKERLSP